MGSWRRWAPGGRIRPTAPPSFAVKGFTESLIDDFAANAPHVKVAVVMPGHVGTDIVANGRVIHRQPDPTEMNDTQLQALRAELAQWGVPTAEMSAAQLGDHLKTMADGFRDNAPVSAAEASRIILEDGVRTGRWRILVGDDARAVDQEVRANPELTYDGLIVQRIGKATGSNS